MLSQPIGRFGTQRAMDPSELTPRCLFGDPKGRKAQRLDPTPDAWRGRRLPPFFCLPPILFPTKLWLRARRQTRPVAGMPQGIWQFSGSSRLPLAPESVSVVPEHFDTRRGDPDLGWALPPPAFLESALTAANSSARGKISPPAIWRVYPRRIQAIECRPETAVWRKPKVLGGPL
jgi:hypothetical protein